MKHTLRFLALLIILSCKKQPAPVPSAPGTPVPAIVGTWLWDKSVGGFGGGTIRPSFAGYQQIYIFDLDSSLTIIRAGAKFNDTTYTIYKFTPDSAGASTGIVRVYAGQPGDYWVQIKADTLRLDEAYVSDGYEHWFHRTK